MDVKEVVVFVIICGIISTSIAGRNKELPTKILTIKTSTLGQSCEIPPPPNKTEVEETPDPFVGSCTLDNNEMCGPVVPETTPEKKVGEGRSSSQTGGQLDIHKGFMQNDDPGTNGSSTEGKCICAYRNEKYEKLILLLAPDENGICRGPLGFPCKKYFLGEDKEGREGFDESCVSGKCDKTTAMCTEKKEKDKPKNAAKKRSAKITLIVAELLIILVSSMVGLRIVEYALKQYN